MNYSLRKLGFSPDDVEAFAKELDTNLGVTKEELDRVGPIFLSLCDFMWGLKVRTLLPAAVEAFAKEKKRGIKEEDVDRVVQVLSALSELRQRARQARILQERRREASETYDHILWDAIIRVCGDANSRAFESRDDGVWNGIWRVRVVYETPIDPRGDNFEKIKKVVEEVIEKQLPIRKERYSFCTGIGEVLSRCSKKSYQDFLGQILWKITSEPGEKYDAAQQAAFMRAHPNLSAADCEVVVISKNKSDVYGREIKDEDYIYCPCTGEHLRNTGDLKLFTIKLEAPKKKGENKYEFRFEVSNK